jgi:hypothetical protein
MEMLNKYFILQNSLPSALADGFKRNKLMALRAKTQRTIWAKAPLCSPFLTVD